MGQVNLFDVRNRYGAFSKVIGLNENFRAWFDAENCYSRRHDIVFIEVLLNQIFRLDRKSVV